MLIFGIFARNVYVCTRNGEYELLPSSIYEFRVKNGSNGHSTNLMMKNIMISKLINKIFSKKEEAKTSQPESDVERTDKAGGDYIDVDAMELSSFIHLESVYQHQEIKFPRCTNNKHLTVGTVLHEIFNVDPDAVVKMGVTQRESGETKCSEISKEDIWTYNLVDSVLTSEYEGHRTWGQMIETVLIVTCIDRHFILTLNGLGGLATIKYMRLNILSPNNSSVDDCVSNAKSSNLPTTISFVISYSESDNNPELQKYEDIEKKVLAKQKTGNDYDEIERQYIHGKFEFQGYYYIGYGKWLFEQERYYDAYVTLIRAFNLLKSNLDDTNTNVMQAYYDVCCKLGECLDKLGRNEEAAYYFRLGAPGLNVEQANHRALSLAKMGNPIAINEMNDWLELVAQSKGSHENWSEEIKNMGVNVPLELSNYKNKTSEILSKEVSCDNGLTLGYILNLIFGIEPKHIFSEMYIFDTCQNKFNETIDSPEAIVNYKLNTTEAKDKTFIFSITRAHYNYNDSVDKSILCIHAPVVISTHSIKDAKGRELMRVDAIRGNFPNDDDNVAFTRYNVPEHTSFILSVDEGISFGQTKDELVKCNNTVVDLTSNGQVIEAYKLSKWIFDCTLVQMTDQLGCKFETEDQDLWNLLFEACYHLGFALMEINKMESACYYLEISSQGMHSQAVQEYINCLCNTQDPLAISAIDSVISNSPKPENEEELKAWNSFMAFLNRRKAYVLIDLKKFKEARELLNEMLNNPLCKEFAERELQYLNSLERKN